MEECDAEQETKQRTKWLFPFEKAAYKMEKGDKKGL
jgi:hypothetical protein